MEKVNFPLDKLVRSGEIKLTKNNEEMGFIEFQIRGGPLMVMEYQEGKPITVVDGPTVSKEFVEKFSHLFEEAT